MSTLLNKDYMQKWIKSEQDLAKKNFTWASLEEENDYHQYMSMDAISMSKEEFDAISLATKNIKDVLNKFYHYILDKPFEAVRLGLPPESWDAVKIKSDLFSYFTRLDLIINEGDIKLIEVNCDTPTGYLESSVANAYLCEMNGLKDMNNLEQGIYKAWELIKESYGISAEQKVYFTSFGENEEDRQTVLFNMKHSGLENTEYIPVESLMIDDNGVWDMAGNKVEFLYRLYPLEFLVEDYDDNGRFIGKMFLDHVANGNLKIINPPSSFMMQSKSVMAMIWDMHISGHELFSNEEHEIIDSHFLPTYFKPDTFIESKTKYVKKPIFGREGGGVKLIDEDNEIFEMDEEEWYDQWKKVYQQYVEMPNETLMTWDGEYTGKLLVGSFLIGGEPSGLFMRVGEKITGNLSMFCGVGVK